MIFSSSLAILSSFPRNENLNPLFVPATLAAFSGMPLSLVSEKLGS
jgi:hypothetical protein